MGVLSNFNGGAEAGDVLYKAYFFPLRRKEKIRILGFSLGSFTPTKVTFYLFGWKMADNSLNFLCR